jgi:hypothetical protein
MDPGGKDAIDIANGARQFLAEGINVTGPLLDRRRNEARSLEYLAKILERLARQPLNIQQVNRIGELPFLDLDRAGPIFGDNTSCIDTLAKEKRKHLIGFTLLNLTVEISFAAEQRNKKGQSKANAKPSPRLTAAVARTAHHTTHQLHSARRKQLVQRRTHGAGALRDKGNLNDVPVDIPQIHHHRIEICRYRFNCLMRADVERLQ